MTRSLNALALLVGMFLLPLAGALVAGDRPLGDHFRFPPEIVRSYLNFSVIGTGLVLVLPVLWLAAVLFPARFGFRVTPAAPRPPPRGRFPAWGWVGLAMVAVSWLASWVPIEPLRAVRTHAFTPLWLGYVLTVDGLVHRRKSHSLLSRSPRGFVALFPASAVIWWLFEYLNRFVENWYYLGIDGWTPLEYLVFVTPAFSTVLPALLETAELLGAQGWVARRWAAGPAWRGATAGSVALGAAGGASLFLMGVWPKYLFPFAWLGPLLVLLPFVHRWMPERSVLARVARGDYRELAALSLCGPVCGVFWEMWNFLAFPKWEYQVPFVTFARVFEMPALGYFGYVPFGWECLLLWCAWKAIFRVGSDRIEIVDDATGGPRQLPGPRAG